VDFSRISSGVDPVWARYAEQFGSQDDFDGHRESGDLPAIADRATEALRFLASCQETSIAVVSHNAFLTHMFNSDLGGIVEFGDDKVKSFLQKPWQNCELRTVGVEISCRCLAAM